MITSRRVRWAGHVALALCRTCMRVLLVSESLEAGDHMEGLGVKWMIISKHSEEIVYVD
jgi:hypothetical protein